MAHSGPIIVVKVGGSLLDWPELPGRLRAYLDDRRAARLIVLVGGGATVDVIRALDRIHELGDERAHTLALHALDLSAAILAALVPNLDVVHDAATLERAWATGRTPVFAPRRFLDDDDRTSADPLPHRWDVTSDAIAARLADRLGAVELVLLKSAPLPLELDREGAAQLGLVDPAFPEAARRLGRVIYLEFRRAGVVPVSLT
jgi:aspartokinase-like uncharacterized kinase